MADVKFKGASVKSIGNHPAVGSVAPEFTLTKSDMSDLHLSDFAGKRVILNIFLSLDTGTCAATVRQFNSIAQNTENTVVLCVSMDLPYAQKRFCVAEGLENVVPVSAFRSPEFGKDYGVTITDGPLKGLLARSVIIIDENKKVIYTQQVPEMSLEPVYEEALAVL